MNIQQLFDSLKAYINSVIGDKITIIDQKTTEASGSASTASTKATEAAASATAANSSKAAAATSATNAKTSETNSKASETAAKTSETNSKTSETNSKASETAAKTSETNSKASETAAATSASQAETSRASAQAAQTAIEGKVMTWRGAWSSSTAYTKQDVVSYNGSSYYATANIASGQAAPPAGSWALVAQGGSAAWENVTNKPTVFPTNSANVSDSANWSDGTPAYSGRLSRFNAEGHLTMGVDPASGNHLSRKSYVDAQRETRVAKAGKTTTMWSGTQAEYDALPSATKNAAGFIAVIAG